MLHELTVVSEEELITLALQNLVSNGVKFSSRGTVRIAAELSQEARPGPCVLSVSDQGPGIGPEHLGRIFEAFRRGDMHGQAGVGLGLAIASRAVKLLGGELTVESNVGTGSTFRIALPSE